MHQESVARYLQQLDTADRQEPSEALKTETSRPKEKIAKLKEQMQRLEKPRVQLLLRSRSEFTRPRPEGDIRHWRHVNEIGIASSHGQAICLSRS